MSDYDENWSELVKTRSLLRDLYWQLESLRVPAKHPQQLERREQARVLLGITRTAESQEHPSHVDQDRPDVSMQQEPTPRGP